MKTPYQVLEVAVDANDAEIKRAYLQKVKENPPDSDPEVFKVIHQAYELIRDHKSRISYDLFHEQSADFEELLDHAFGSERRTPELNSENFIKLLRAGIDNIKRVITTDTAEKR